MKIRVFMTGLMLIAKSRSGPFKDHWCAAMLDTSKDADSMKHSPFVEFLRHGGKNETKETAAGNYGVGTSNGILDVIPSPFDGGVGSTDKFAITANQARSWHWMLSTTHLLGGQLPDDLSCHGNRLPLCASFRLNGCSLETALLAEATGDTSPILFDPPVNRVATEIALLEANVADSSEIYLYRDEGKGWQEHAQLQPTPGLGTKVVDVVFHNSRPEDPSDPRRESPHFQMLSRVVGGTNALVPARNKAAGGVQPGTPLWSWFAAPGIPDRPLCMPGG